MTTSQQGKPTLTPRQKVEYAQQALTSVSQIGHAELILTLNSAVAATYAEADEYIKGARTHVKAAQATRDIEGSLDRLAAVIRAASAHAPAFYASDMEEWAQRVEFAGMPDDSSDGLESWAYEIADALAHLDANPLPKDEADLEGR